MLLVRFFFLFLTYPAGHYSDVCSLLVMFALRLSNLAILTYHPPGTISYSASHALCCFPGAEESLVMQNKHSLVLLIAH